MKYTIKILSMALNIFSLSTWANPMEDKNPFDEEQSLCLTFEASHFDSNEDIPYPEDEFILIHTRSGEEIFQTIGNHQWPHIFKIFLSHGHLTRLACERLSQENLFNLKYLYLNSNPIGDDGALALSRGYFPHLSYLNLSHANLGDDGAIALGQGDWPFLETLLLDYNSINTKGAVGLARGHWPELNFLDISFNCIQDEGVHAIAHANWFNLRRLYLLHNFIHNTGVMALCEKFPVLEELALSENEIEDEGAIALAKNKWPCLTQLSLDYNQIGDKGFSAICQGEWPFLTHLVLTYNKITHESINDLHTSHWPQLTELYLAMNTIGSFEVLNIWKLHVLSLDHTNLTNECALSIVNEITTAHIKILGLSFSLIETSWVRAAKDKDWNSLELLDLTHSLIDDEGAKILMDFKLPCLISLVLRGIDLKSDTKLQLSSFFKNKIILTENP